MNEKEVMQNFLMEQLKILRKKDVKTLMRNKETQKLERIATELKLDYNPIMEYKKAIYERQEEIPRDYILELICYIKISGIEDWKFFKDSEYPVNVLQEEGQQLLAIVQWKRLLELFEWKNLERAKIGRVTGCRFFIV